MSACGGLLGAVPDAAPEAVRMTGLHARRVLTSPRPRPLLRCGACPALRRLRGPSSSCPRRGWGSLVGVRPAIVSDSDHIGAWVRGQEGTCRDVLQCRAFGSTDQLWCIGAAVVCCCQHDEVPPTRGKGPRHGWRRSPPRHHQSVRPAVGRLVRPGVHLHVEQRLHHHALSLDRERVPPL